MTERDTQPSRRPGRPRVNPEGSRVVSARLWPSHLAALDAEGGTDSEALRSLLDELLARRDAE